MKIALGQLICKLGDVPANLAAMERLARQAKAQGADAVVFPEMSDTGYDMPTILRTASGAVGAPRRRLAMLAQELSMWIIAGLSLREGEEVFNTTVVFDRAGAVKAEYRKIHLFSGQPIAENTSLAAGRDLVLFDFEGLCTGLMICYDLRFPELARALTLAGAEMLVIPSAWPPARIAHWDALLVARAIENQLYVAGVNRGGRDGEVEFGGHSAAIDPAGKYLYRSEDSSENIFVVEVMSASVREVRQAFRFLHDRRPALYSG